MPTHQLQTERLLTPEEAKKRLGVTSDRRLQVLAKQGRIVKRREPAGDGRQHPQILYTADSIEAELARRAAGVQTQALATIPPAMLERFWTPPPTESVPTSTDFADYAFVTVDEAAAMVRMPASWIETHCRNGNIPHTETLRGGLRIRAGDVRRIDPSTFQKPRNAAKRAH